MKIRNRIQCLIPAVARLTLALLVLTAGSVQARTRWWDGGTTYIGSNGNSASGGGTGTWSTTILNWDAGASPHVAWNNANNDTAIFDGTAGTVNVAVPITVGGVIFNVASYSFTGTPVEIASGAIVKGKGGVTASIAGFALAAGNTTYRFESTDTSTGAFGNTRIFTMPTSLTGAGNSVVISGTQPVYLTGTNSYGGTTTVNSGAAAGFNTANLDGMGGGPGVRSILVADGASLLRQGGSLNDAFLNCLALTTNTFTIYANNASCGNTLIHSGTLYITHNLALQNSAIDTSATGTMDVTGATAPTFGGLKGSKSIDTLITTAYGSVTGLTLNPGAGVTNSYSGVLSNGAAGMTLTKTCLGTQILTGANTYIGATTISGGTLQIGAGGATGSIATTSGVTNNGTLVYNRSNNLSVGHVISVGAILDTAPGVLTVQVTPTLSTLSFKNGSLAHQR